jgi:hypothetical protein
MLFFPAIDLDDIGLDAAIVGIDDWAVAEPILSRDSLREIAFSVRR